MKTHSRSWSAITILAFMALTPIILISKSARAAGPWYVAPGGSDGNSCLSAGSPCATINGAIGKASSGDTIYVATGTYTNSTGLEVVLIDKDITLSGGWDPAFATQSGMSTIDGGGVRRGIKVNSGVTAIIEGFVIQNGSTGTSPNYDYGGGISNGGTLTLNNSTVSGNTASNSNPSGGGIYNNSGTMILNNSTVNGNTALYDACGGIANSGTLTLNYSTVSDNTSGLEGGICNDGTLTLNNSTVNGNTSQLGGGGGIGNFVTGTVTLNNSTVSDNTDEFDQGGGIFNYATVTLNNSTVSGNIGGGIYNGGTGTVTLQNSILAGNTASGTGPDCTGTTDSSGYNLIGDTSGCTFTPGTGDLTNINADLGQLIGSPGYQPLLSGSPAINAGNPAGCTDNLGNPLNTDQRGATRVGRCDIGAYEYTPPGPAVSVIANRGTSQRTPPLVAFKIPLQAAVLDSLGSPVSNTVVTFSAPTSGASGTFADSGTNTTTAVTNASGVAAAATFTANGVQGTYLVTATVSGIITPANFLLSNLAWYVASNGDDNLDCQTPATACATINGALAKGGFVVGDTILVASGTYTSSTGDEVVLLNKSAALSGGWDATFTVQSDTSTIDGGGARRGITVNGVTAIIEHFVIQNGSSGASQNGGGIANDGNLTLNNSTISGNSAGNSGSGFGGGGGIYNVGTLTLNSSAVSGNIILGGFSGNGIFNSSIYGGGTLTLNNSTVSGNSSQSSRGGGISSDSGTVTLNTSTVSGNTASSGGGIYNNGTLTLTNSTVSNNISSGSGGIINDGSGTVTLTNSTISGNTSQFGSGGINNFGTLNLNSSTVSGNMASNNGGGIGNYGGTLTLQNSILAGNTAAGAGRDCYGTLTSQGYNLIQNTSDCTITGDTTGNLTGMDPLLGPLQDNGGPTLTHALLPGSPAIDAGNPATPGSGGNACETTDQRGIARPQRASCDMGAFELEPPVAFSSNIFSVIEDAGTAAITVTLDAVSALTVTVDYTTSDGTATAGSDYVPATGTLTFPPGVLTQTFSVTITDDALDEADETVTLTLSNFVNAIPGVPYLATLTIVDNEFKVYLPLILK